jgi:catechol 2,3-dioxygenase-like lactoylglutathione lyase family enzyme
MLQPPMAQPSIAVHCIQHLCLRVRDVQRSVDFYCGVLGFQEQNGGPCEKPDRVCRLFDAETGAAFELILTLGLPPGDYLVGLDHLAFDTRSPEMVDSIYRRAVDASIQAARPRLQDGRWKSFLFDPDGYKLEISADPDETTIDQQVE